MKDPFLTCEYDHELIKLLKGRSVVFYSKNFSVFDTLKKDAELNNVHIHCVYIKTKTSLSDIIFEEKWNLYPLAIESPSLGRVFEFLLKTPVIRKLNIRFYMQTKEPSCYRDIRILSSLGYSASVIIDGEKTDWKQLTDLMVYALLNQKNHAEIHPFNFTCRNYQPHSRTNFDAVYFNDPERYLHIGKNGSVFLRKEHISDSKTPVCSLDSVDAVAELEAYSNEINKWSRFFVEPTKCASCKGWRICLGKYSNYLDSNPGCEHFFSEFIDAIETERKIHEKKTEQLKIWQP